MNRLKGKNQGYKERAMLKSKVFGAQLKKGGWLLFLREEKKMCLKGGDFFFIWLEREGGHEKESKGKKREKDWFCFEKGGKGECRGLV